MAAGIAGSVLTTWVAFAPCFLWIFLGAPYIEALRGTWADRDDCEIVVYASAEHGFVHDPERPAHRADDAADAWSRVLAFLEVA